MRKSLLFALMLAIMILPYRIMAATTAQQQIQPDYLGLTAPLPDESCSLQQLETVVPTASPPMLAVPQTDNFAVPVSGAEQNVVDLDTTTAGELIGDIDIA